MQAAAGQVVRCLLTPGEYLLNGGLDVNGFNLTIAAHASSGIWATLDAQHTRLFTIRDGGALSLINLRLVNGWGFGGGLAQVTSSEIFITNCLVESFSTSVTVWGGVLNLYDSSHSDITGCTITNTSVSSYSSVSART